jgi:hypothetical protein
VAFCCSRNEPRVAAPITERALSLYLGAMSLGSAALAFHILNMPGEVRMDSASESARLFSYGTLQGTAVQLALFGRALSGSPDSLPGFALSWLKITDPDVVSTSGETFHPVIRPTGQHSDVVVGTVFEITREELLKADTYEAENYQRMKVSLATGALAWVYVLADEPRRAASMEPEENGSDDA